MKVMKSMKRGNAYTNESYPEGDLGLESTDVVY
jgi:hypothetical protein